jgi:hypothetical protein
MKRMAGKPEKKNILTIHIHAFLIFLCHNSHIRAGKLQLQLLAEASTSLELIMSC